MTWKGRRKSPVEEPSGVRPPPFLKQVRFATVYMYITVYIYMYICISFCWKFDKFYSICRSVRFSRGYGRKWEPWGYVKTIFYENDLRSSCWWSKSMACASRESIVFQPSFARLLWMMDWSDLDRIGYKVGC